MIAVDMDDERISSKGDVDASLQPKTTLFDLNVPALPISDSEKETEITNLTPKSSSNKKKGSKRVRFPSLTKEERTKHWREEKRRTRAKLTPEVRLARYRHDQDVKRERFKNALNPSYLSSLQKPEEQEALLAMATERRLKHRRKARAVLQAERAQKGIKSTFFSKYDP
ncbi:uncharacterized protein FA14DRAFT_154384 [Meira miltonrushii]|uniref:Uncharacterized protein n=1 Tax=Meira miltonrushii TaxID=1280837 RepID=A0A316VCY1_9BASI|nr:uncharacterized protein FA14DRAFT_154384 [Meira miltonrushii]PWN34948.1 hypothetical protein FA14DRAFT_154384 [Meira miltonrushii]